MSLQLQAAMEELAFIKCEIKGMQDPDILGPPTGTETYLLNAIKLKYRLIIMHTGASMLENIIDRELGRQSTEELIQQLQK